LKFATLVNYYFRQIAELANVHLDPNESGQFIFVHGRKIIVRHLTKKNPHNPERMKFTAFQGEFVVKGKPELLMALTVLGLGARRSQGFGLLELVEGHA
ncbi:MAG: hypothetical protein NZT61_06655, partial [Deltaproteobacteria bacterium]|nr:hypothetical protein [Deltaproteobacteria bacterium]